MLITREMVISGFISKVVNEVVDVPLNPIKNAIKNADKKKRDNNQSIETRIYQVTIDSLNKYTNDKYKGQETLYDAAEGIIKGFKSNKNSNPEAVRAGLKMLVSQVTSDTCEDFLKILHHEICIDENGILYKEIILLKGEQTFEAVCEGFDASNKNDEETHEKLDHVIEGLNNIDKKIGGIENDEKKHYEAPIRNRADKYANRWNENVFLNNFNEEDENAGVNIKLKDIYRDECLPHYIWGQNTKPSDKLNNYLMKYINNNNEKKMSLILGQPGLGKSTLITWIMANLVEKKDEIFVYQFAADLDGIDWQNKDLLTQIFKIIGLEKNELENKKLILDGFDEIYIYSDRERILNNLNQGLRKLNTLKSFSLIITCRENYIYNLQNIKCDYIVLLAWEEAQIETFCRAYWGKCKKAILESKIQKIQENKEIFGIPLILYMILALDIAIEKSSSIVDVYDQIFSLERGVIFDRCYDLEHRINLPEIKEHIYRVSQKMAFWMFENNAEKAFISQEKFEEICVNEMSEYGEKGKDIQSDTLIGNFFKLKHSEGKGTDELQFVHRSIYEYFVAVYFFESLHKLKIKEEVAGKLGELLKDGRLSEQILVFIKYKFDSIKEHNLSDITREIFNIMLRDGMTYYTKVENPYNNVIVRERNIFSNMLKIVGLWNSSLGKLDKRIIIYLQCNREKQLKLSGFQLGVKNVDMKEVNLNEVDLSGAYLSGADLSEADLRGADLRGADLSEANLSGADLSRADLRGADLSEADLSGADLSKADLSRTDLIGADLRGANLSVVFLRGADLIGADLRGAELSRANLSGAELSRANLSGVYLSKANLVGAYLDETDLSKSDLSEANLVGADLSETDLSKADLSEANLVGADLEDAELSEANLKGTVFDEKQVNELCKKYDLSACIVWLSKTKEVVSFIDYYVKSKVSKELFGD